MGLTLFEECIQDLGSRVTILSEPESDIIVELLQEHFPFICANIEWEKIHTKKQILTEEPYLIIPTLESWLSKADVEQPVYIVWDNGSVPVVKIDNLIIAIEYISDIAPVGTRTWFFNPELGYVIEWHRCGNKTIGLRNSEKSNARL